MAVAPQLTSDVVFADFSVLGKKAFVTGGSRGIGRACALTLAAAGADVAIGWSPTGSEGAEAVCREIRALGRRGEAYACDLAVRSAVDTTCRRVAEDFQ